MIQQKCACCEGSGIVTLGMSFDEAIELAQNIRSGGERSGPWGIAQIERHTQGPQNVQFYTVIASHIPTGGTQVTFKSPAAWDAIRNVAHWVPDAARWGSST